MIRLAIARFLCDTVGIEYRFGSVAFPLVSESSPEAASRTFSKFWSRRPFGDVNSHD
jgi:hypothetical protein